MKGRSYILDSGDVNTRAGGNSCFGQMMRFRVGCIYVSPLDSISELLGPLFSYGHDPHEL
jgi:hypothetical protein